MRITFPDEMKGRLRILMDKIRAGDANKQEVYDFLDDSKEALAQSFSDYYNDRGESISRLEALTHAAMYIDARKKEFGRIKEGEK